jgi:hypothetical protein
VPKRQDGKPKIDILSKVRFTKKEPEPAPSEKPPLLRIIDKKPLEMAPPSTAHDLDEKDTDGLSKVIEAGNKVQRPGFAITISNKPEDGWYDVVATSTFSPGRQVRGRFKIPYTEEYVTEVLDHLSRRVQDSRGEPVMVPSTLAGNGSEEPIDEFGRQLYRGLFTREVEELYADAVDKADAQFPISLITGAQEVKQLPWEFLHDGRGFICTNVGPIFRVIPGAKPSASDLQVTEPLKLLIVPSNPPGSQNLDVEEEEEEIRSILGKAPIQIFKPESQKVNHLLKILLTTRPHIIHFIGHGDKTGIRFKNHMGEIVNIGDQLGEMFIAADFLPRIVILNACTTDTLAASLVNMRVPMVVAMQFRISDQAAIAFSRGFYEYVAAGLPIQKATAWGRLAIKATLREKLQVEWATPVVYANPKVNLG